MAAILDFRCSSDMKMCKKVVFLCLIQPKICIYKHIHDNLTLFLRDTYVCGDHFEFMAPENSVGIFARRLEAKFLLKCPKNPKQSSKHPHQRLVAKVRILT